MWRKRQGHKRAKNIIFSLGTLPWVTGCTHLARVLISCRASLLFLNFFSEVIEGELREFVAPWRRCIFIAENPTDFVDYSAEKCELLRRCHRVLRKKKDGISNRISLCWVSGASCRSRRSKLVCKKGHAVTRARTTNQDSLMKKVQDDKRHKPMIYIDKVMERARRRLVVSYITPSATLYLISLYELPGNYPFVLQKTFIGRIIKEWHTPAIVLCKTPSNFNFNFFGLDIGSGDSSNV